MKIERTRWIIMRNNRTEILCGMGNHFKFKNINDLDRAPLKTYFSEDKAMSSFLAIPFESTNFEIEIIKATEIIEF